MDALIAPINQALQESSERLAQHASYFIKRIVLREGFRTAQEAKACSLRGDVPVSNPVIWDQPNVDELSAESESFSRNTDCRAAAERDGRVVLMNIITNGRGDKRQLQLLYSIVEATKEIADVAGAVQTIHTEQSLASPAQSAVCIRGQDHLFEAIGHVIVKVSALSFLQVNTQQCVSLLAAVSRAAKLQKHEKVLDLYCGAGTIALWLAREASSVLGFEWCRAAIADARSNAALNGIKHVRFEWGDLECLGSRGGGLQRQLEGIDVVVVDPPRSGLSAEVMRLLSSCSARTVVYVSCWPASLCRDIAAFQASGWSCVSVTGVDMFPQTEHLETVAALERK
jgi:23S rRNA (uracil1939-C5)-methyltransferase